MTKQQAIKTLRSNKEIIAINEGAFIFLTVLALELLSKSSKAVAKVVKGY